MTNPTALELPLHRAMELAWESIRNGSLGIGAVITTEAGEIITTGRNRLFEDDPGDDLLAGSSVAHAEMNALTKMRKGLGRGAPIVLWTTLVSRSTSSPMRCGIAWARACPTSRRSPPRPDRVDQPKWAEPRGR